MALTIWDDSGHRDVVVGQLVLGVLLGVATVIAVWIRIFLVRKPQPAEARQHNSLPCPSLAVRLANPCDLQLVEVGRRRATRSPSAPSMPPSG